MLIFNATGNENAVEPSASVKIIMPFDRENHNDLQRFDIPSQVLIVINTNLAFQVPQKVNFGLDNNSASLNT